MRGNRRLAWTIGLSVIVHGVVLAVFIDPPPVPTAQRVLDLVIERPLPEPEALEPTELPAVVEEPPVTETPVEPLVEEFAETPPAPEPEEPVESATPPVRAVLNLQRPDNWEDLIDRIPDPDVRLHFNEELEQGVAAAEEERRRRQLVGDRVGAVYGVPDEAYSRIGPRGSEIKINGACYVMIDSPAIEEGARWWRGPCTDTKMSSFLLDPIEYDALGRVVAD